MLVNKIRDEIDKNKTVNLDISVHRMNLSFQISELTKEHMITLYKNFKKSKSDKNFEDIIKES
ncbi:MAG: hypothetical protein ACTSWD_09530 [Candidatus Heimdallarchaeota archaeon]